MRLKTFLSVLAGGFIGWIIDRIIPTYGGIHKIANIIYMNDLIVWLLGILMLVFGGRFHPILPNIGIGMIVFEAIEEFGEFMGETTTNYWYPGRA